MAAQARVLSTEAQSTNGLECWRRRHRLRAWVQASVYITRLARWRSWFESAAVETLPAVVEHLTAQGIGPAAAEAALSRNTPRPWPQAVAKTVQSGIQRWISGRLEEPPAGWAETRMRSKLARWRLSGFPRVHATRALAALRSLQSLVTPRVQAAVLSTLYNRWVTDRRFQRGRGSCRLGCTADDSIEHYLRCEVVHSFAHRRLGLRLSREERWEVLLFVRAPSEHGHSSRLLQKLSILIYAVYRVVNALRHCHPLPPEELDRALQQAVTEAVRGHRQSSLAASFLWR